MRNRTKTEMKRIEKTFYTLCVLFILSVIAWGADLLEEYWPICAMISANFLIGVIITDCMMRSIESDIAELLRKENKDEAA